VQFFVGHFGVKVWKPQIFNFLCFRLIVWETRRGAASGSELLSLLYAVSVSSLVWLTRKLSWQLGNLFRFPRQHWWTYDIIVDVIANLRKTIKTPSVCPSDRLFELKLIFLELIFVNPFPWNFINNFNLFEFLVVLIHE
jgi:hypothetical protein